MTNNLSLNDIVQHFAPGWFASVMGTAVIAVAIFVFRLFVPFAAIAQGVLLAFAVVLFAVLIIPWVLRWIHHPDSARRDLNNPVSAAFFPTMPISLLVIGIALEKTAPAFLPEATLWAILQTLWVFGSAGILVFALVLITIFIEKPEVKWESSTLGWLIPPVSALLIPVLGLSLAGHYVGTTWGTVTLFGSLLFLGAGTVLFILILAMVFNRYIFYPQPPVHLAPTLWVGLAPTSILAITALRLVKPLKAALGFSIQTEETLNVLMQVGSVALWGFALFWLALAVTLTLRTHRRMPLPFALSWWAFVFPMGAFTVSTGVIYQTFPLDFFLWIGLTGLAALLILWLITVVRTLQGAFKGTIFLPHASPASVQTEATQPGH
ncbi:MAG: hypothetical protein JNL73_09100 [Anaerolineales bacterium]|nr:hypothetical protein [Anaerolineales bacterium]